MKPRNLKDCFDIFSDLPNVITDLVALRRITYETLVDFATKDNVVYLELRSTPKCLLFDHRNKSEVATKRDYIDAILSTMEEFMQSQPPPNKMMCRLIISVDRSLSYEEAKENIELAIEYSQQSPPLVVGVDLGGNPMKNSFQLFQPLFERVREHNEKRNITYNNATDTAAGTAPTTHPSKLGITIHCGEIPCAKADHETETDSDGEAWKEAKCILKFHPDRLGHALLLPPDLQKELANASIPIETCPTSNVMTLELNTNTNNKIKKNGQIDNDHDRQHDHGNLIDGLKQHPILMEWISQNHPICICTDDPGIFDTTLTKELYLLYKAFGERAKRKPKKRNDDEINIGDDDYDDRVDEETLPSLLSSSLTVKQIATLVLQSMEYAFCDIETKVKVHDMIRDSIETRIGS